jgi:hypothetical protein
LALRVDVDEIDLGAAVARGIGRGDEGDRAGPQAVARPQAERQAGDVQPRSRCSSPPHGARRRHRPRTLEARHGRALGQEVGASTCTTAAMSSSVTSWRP